MPEEQQPESNLPATSKPSGARRRGRRGGRGRRRPVPVIPMSGQPLPAEPPAKQTEPPIRLSEEMPVRPVPSKQKLQSEISSPIEAPKEPFRNAPRAAKPDGSAISRAVNEVTDIVESLRQALEKMEEVLELVEHAERQKLTDEREIESLLRALRQFQSHGDRPDLSEPPERRERFRRPERPGRPNRPERFRPQRPEPQPLSEHTGQPESSKPIEQPESDGPHLNA